MNRDKNNEISNIMGATQLPSKVQIPLPNKFAELASQMGASSHICLALYELWVIVGIQEKSGTARLKNKSGCKHASQFLRG